MTLGAARIADILDQFDLSPRRSLGQNFVIDPNTVRRIAAHAGVFRGTHVLEIGPGLGSLTLAMTELGARVTAVEIDRAMIPALRAVLTAEGEADAVEIVHADALEVDLATLVDPQQGAWRLAANLPYNVGTTILLRVMEDAPAIAGGVVLVQREVALRLAAQPGHALFGIPSVKMAWWASTSVVGRVPAAVFLPRPKVESAILTFERRSPPGDAALRRRTFSLIDAAFGQRRKMIRRSLIDLVTGDDLVEAGIEPTRRAEELHLDDWVRLARGVESDGERAAVPR